MDPSQPNNNPAPQNNPYPGSVQAPVYTPQPPVQQAPPAPTQQIPAEQPAATPAPVAAPISAPAADPGQTWGILSIVFIFIFAPIGLIFGLVGKSKSKKAGKSNSLSIAGIIINSIITVIYALAIVFVFAGMTWFSDSIKQASDQIDDSNKVITVKTSTPTPTPTVTPTPTPAVSKCLALADYKGLSNVNDGIDYINKLPYQKAFYFKANSTTYDEPAATVDADVAELAAFASKNKAKTFMFLITGSVNASSKDQVGVKLASDRATKIKDALAAKGVPATNLKIVDQKNNDLSLSNIYASSNRNVQVFIDATCK